MRQFARASAIVAAALFAGHAAAEPVYGVTDPSFTSLSLVRFDSATPGAVTTVGAITGVVAGQTLRGIDYRPSNGQLYAISSDAAGSTAQVYTINRATAVATPLGGPLNLAGNTSGRISLDFNPVPDALRVVTGSGQSYRVNANTGALIMQDTSLAPAGQLVAGVAYTNNVVGATQTTLYAYDFNTDTLRTIGGVNGAPSPNGGQTFVVGNTGVVAFSGALGFDISGLTGLAYLSLDDASSPNDQSELFTANLATGALTFVGNSPTFLLDISFAPLVVPEPEMLAMLGIGLASLAGLSRRRRKGVQAA